MDFRPVIPEVNTLYANSAKQKRNNSHFLFFRHVENAVGGLSTIECNTELEYIGSAVIFTEVLRVDATITCNGAYLLVVSDVENLQRESLTTLVAVDGHSFEVATQKTTTVVLKQVGRANCAVLMLQIRSNIWVSIFWRVFGRLSMHSPSTVQR